MSILKLSNLLLLNIIKETDSNIDIICLLLTCKQFYHSSSLKRLIRFKGIRVIDDKGKISKKFLATVFRFNINSFKDILKNSIPDQQVLLLVDHENYPYWIHPYIFAPVEEEENRVDKRNITTALLGDYEPTLINSIYKIPSIETLYIDPHDHDGTLDLGSISLLPNLERLSICSNSFKLGQHSSLKSLTLDVYNIYSQRPYLSSLGLKFISLTELTIKSAFVLGFESSLLPRNLTSLSLKLLDMPPRDMFNSLTSLTSLEIDFERIELLIEEDQEEERPHQFLDFNNLHCLKTLLLDDFKYAIEVSVPPSLQYLRLWSNHIHIAPPSTSLPMLEKLYVLENGLVGGRINPLSYPSLKKLGIFECDNTIPSNLIPSTLEKLKIHKLTLADDIILDQVVFPPSLTSLSIFGDNEPVPNNLPASLIKLKQNVQKAPTVPLPNHLKKLVLGLEFRKDINLLKEDFILLSPYPPNLETFNIIESTGSLKIGIPPTIKYLSLTLSPNPRESSNCIATHSISSRIPKPIDDDQTQQQLWLPPNTTHLTCQLNHTWHHSKWAFRLDKVINHTNVRYLSITIQDNYDLQFSIQRLDPDNRNVLVLETQSLTGGIITQLKRKNNIDQQQQLYSYLFTL
ncbi:hypothetical protein DFA_02307 [Cavenderia fasciculata]|uniref:Uncharacterized protein n=1 Tax=Cavenderia fasciculata TaxID=261658 RepID=F4PZ34_CACFS|nr:uncharacterized protein DFA_02307 [Cavenderia fasciculata]EGG19063.1 hypothetical protein DFA_02307 [Cavenderia fasciculata]|eukprot:XP_004366696.1 hypothetical protein DFA_02307 [Cavenderia fasciculata]